MSEVQGNRNRIASVAIRRATREDTGDLRRVEAAARQGMIPSWPGETDWVTAMEKAFTYLSEDDMPFGFVTSGSLSEPSLDDGHTGEIQALFVHPDYQGFGVGRKLLVHGLSVLRRRGYESALIWVPVAGGAALRIVEALKFRPAGSVRLLNGGQSTTVKEIAWRLDISDYF